jgi:hypothetical protein
MRSFQAKTLPSTEIQLDFSPSETERINWIMAVCAIKNRKDLFNNALTLLEWVVGQVADGRKVASFDDVTNERTALSMPALKAAAVRADRFQRPSLKAA